MAERAASNDVVSSGVSAERFSAVAADVAASIWATAAARAVVSSASLARRMSMYFTMLS